MKKGNNFTVEQLQPFGLLVKTDRAGAMLDELEKEQIFSWIREHRYIVFRGFSLFNKQQFALYAQQLGEPLQWPFGAINELKVKRDTKNYLYTDHAVPLHWDGAFVKKIPYIIFFQCVKAPGAENKGGTVFSDTISVLKHASKEKIEKWKKVSITYKTEKIVHYGGEITQTLIAKHPVTGETVLRFAEPVHDLNPVELTVHGIPENEKENFLAELKKDLYAPEVCVTHAWQDGDILMADNHTMLHGREAFANPNERHIQRINLLERPPKMSIGRWLRLNKTIRRSEFFVAEFPIFLIPLLLAFVSVNDFSSPIPWLSLPAIFFLFNIGDMINCYEDYELDTIYKSHLSNAVYELGKKNIKMQIILSAIIGVGLTALISWLTGRWLLVVMVIVGAFIGIQYSSKPLKFKSRGVWQLFCLWGIIFFGPMVYLSYAVKGNLSIPELILFTAFGFHQMGIILLNTAEDYTEDIAAGLKTIIVALGIQTSMRLAWVLILLSGIALQTCFAWIYAENHFPVYSYGVIAVFSVAWIYILAGFRKIIREISGKNAEDATKVLKENGMKVPEWLKLAAYTCLLSAAGYFVFKLLFPL